MKYPSHFQYSSITCASGPRHFFYVQRHPKQALGVTSDILVLSLKLTLVLLQLDPLTLSSPLGERYFWKKTRRVCFLQAFKSIFPHGNCSSRINFIQHRKLTRWALEIPSQSLSPSFLNLKKKKNLSRSYSTLSFKVSTEIPLMNIVLQNLFHLKSFLLLTNIFQISLWIWQMEYSQNIWRDCLWVGMFNASEFTKKFWEIENVPDLGRNFLSTTTGQVKGK